MIKIKKEMCLDFHPRGWEIYNFDHLFEFGSGLSISRDKLSDVGICYLHYGDIHKTTDNYLDMNKCLNNMPRLNETLSCIDARYLLSDGDIVFADASEDYQGIGKAITVLNQQDIPLVSGLHTIIARDKTNFLDREYKRFFLSDGVIRKQFMFYATGISVLGISKSNIKKINVILPPLSEQQKIARILSTWDKAIELKEKLLEQKKEQKKGLMQNLLTGKVRWNDREKHTKEEIKERIEMINRGAVLEGYKRTNLGIIPDEWDLRCFRAVARINPKRETITDHYPVSFIGMSDVSIQAKVIKYHPRMYSEVANGFTFFRNKDILVAKITPCFENGKGALVDNLLNGIGFGSTEFHVIRPNNLDDSLFLYYHTLTQRFRGTGEKNMTGSAGQKRVSSNFINMYLIPYPRDRDERIKIAKILFNADKAIELGETEIAVLKQQKKGLIQLLLTGKVRVTDSTVKV